MKPCRSGATPDAANPQEIIKAMNPRMIYAFDHVHKAGDICSHAECTESRCAPALAGSEVIDDLPMRILRPATRQEYIYQNIPRGWTIPPLGLRLRAHLRG